MNFLMDRPTARYGGVDIAFMGDFRQLPPIGVKTIYDSRNLVQFKDYINCFIELYGMYRFKDDPKYGELCKRFRDGCPTLEDFNIINSRLVSPFNPLPKNVRVACKTNAEREAINTAIWIKHLKTHGEQQGLIVLANNIQIRQDGAPEKPLSDLLTFWTKVGEDDCTTTMEGRFTPMLRLYPDCPLMMTENADVVNNQANGTQGICKGVRLKPGQQVHHRQVHDMKVKCVYASQIDHLLWQVGLDTMKIKPNQYNALSANFPLPDCLKIGSSKCKKHNVTAIFLKATQIPLISNDATTGHKLQGSSVDNMYLPSWSYQLNWPYVMLSRVRTLNGLFLGKPLDPKADYSIPQNLTRMIRGLRKSASPTPFDSSVLHL